MKEDNNAAGALFRNCQIQRANLCELNITYDFTVINIRGLKAKDLRNLLKDEGGILSHYLRKISGRTEEKYLNIKEKQKTWLLSSSLFE